MACPSDPAASRVRRNPSSWRLAPWGTMGNMSDVAPASEFRIEHDTMGEVRVPATALYRAQTQRAVENFPISGTPLESSHIRSLAQIKKAAAALTQNWASLKTTWRKRL